MRWRPSSWGAWGLFALFLTLSAGVAYLESRGVAPGPGESVTETASLLMAFTAFALVGALIASRQPRNLIGWLLLAIGLGTVSTGFAGAYAEFSLTRPVPLPGTLWVAWYQSWSWLPSVALAFIFLPLLFPTGRLPSPRWRPVAAAGVALSGAFAAVGAFSPTIDIGSDGPSATRRLMNPLGIEAVQRLERGVAEAVFELTSLAVILLVLASVVVRYRRSPQDQREQLKWFVFAVLLNVVGAVGGELLPPPLNSNVVFAMIVSLLPISIGVAVLKYRLYDIDVVINKTLVYGALAAFITAVYVGVVVGIGTAIGTGREPNLGLQIAATALVAVAFQPVRARVQRLANRLVYGKRATPYEVMARFGDRMADSIELEEVLPRTAEAAAGGVGAARSRVRVFLPDGTQREARWPEGDAPADGYHLALLVKHQGETVGEIAVAKSAGDALRPAEEALLRDLASQAGLAFHNVRLTTDLRSRLDEISRQAGELRESQARIVTAADDERRRLERTIEDRVESRLEGLARDLKSALGGSNDGAAVAARLEALRTATQETLEDLREIARGIYPPLLADRGLAAALEAQTRRAPRSVRLSIEGLGRYAEEIEAGVYFCSLEAVAGGVSGVRLDVRDDGRGVSLTIDGELSRDAVTRIRDRIEALGGELDMDTGAVRAQIPVREVVG